LSDVSFADEAGRTNGRRRAPASTARIAVPRKRAAAQVAERG
jgi:hypothetical protein